jgi:hypothetical protein
MKTLGCDVVIAVDVASVDDTSPVMYGDSLSGWTVMLSRWNPFYRFARIPSLADIQQRLAYISSVSQLETAKADEDVLYLRVPVTQFGTLDFGKFHDIEQVGYKFGKEMVQHWKATGVMDRLSGVCKDSGRHFKKQRYRQKGSGNSRWKTLSVSATRVKRESSHSRRASRTKLPSAPSGLAHETSMETPTEVSHGFPILKSPPLARDAPSTADDPIVLHTSVVADAPLASGEFANTPSNHDSDVGPRKMELMDDVFRDGVKGDLDEWLSSLDSAPRRRRGSV